MPNLQFPRFVSILLLLFTCLQQLSSQKNVAGRIVDSITREAIPYAHLYLTETSKLLLSNEKGVYPKPKIQQGKLIVSSIGYNTKEIDLSSLTQLPEEILLIPSVTSLEQVEVTSMSANGLLSKAINQIPQNYPTQSFLGTYYYRAQAIDTQRERALYVEECIFQQEKQYTKNISPTSA